MTITVCEDKKQWDQYVNKLGGHPLQLWGWGELKALHNWRPVRLVYQVDGKVKGGAQVLIRPLPWPFRKFCYVPRGPFGDLGGSRAAMKELGKYVKRHIGGTVLSAEPDMVAIDWGRRWRQSSNTILIPSTLVIDLSKKEDVLLADMTKKTRQYIRKSENDGVVVRQLTTRAELVEALIIYNETAKRANFPLHDLQYYHDCAESLGEHSLIFGAFHEERLVSFLWLAVTHRTAFELYGGMNEDGQLLRANYTLKWQAIRQCKERKIAKYDLNGLLTDGVTAFKEGFSSHRTQLVGTYDRPLSLMYPLWSKLLPSAKKIARMFKNN